MAEGLCRCDEVEGLEMGSLDYRGDVQCDCWGLYNQEVAMGTSGEQTTGKCKQAGRRGNL